MKKNMFKVFVLFLMVFTVTFCFNYDTVDAAKKKKSTSTSAVQKYAFSDPAMVLGEISQMTPAAQISTVNSLFDFYAYQQPGYLGCILKLVSNAASSSYTAGIYAIMYPKAIEVLNVTAADPLRTDITFIYNPNNEIIGYGKTGDFSQSTSVYLYNLNLWPIYFESRVSAGTYKGFYYVFAENKVYNNITEVALDHKELFEALINGTYDPKNPSIPFYNDVKPEFENSIEGRRARGLQTGIWTEYDEAEYQAVTVGGMDWGEFRLQWFSSH